MSEPLAIDLLSYVSIAILCGLTVDRLRALVTKAALVYRSKRKE